MGEHKKHQTYFHFLSSLSLPFSDIYYLGGTSQLFCINFMNNAVLLQVWSIAKGGEGSKGDREIRLFNYSSKTQLPFFLRINPTGTEKPVEHRRCLCSCLNLQEASNKLLSVRTISFVPPE